MNLREGLSGRVNDPALAEAQVETAAVTRIRPPRGSLDINLSELWEYRELLYFLVWRDVKVRYKQTVIGVGWAIIQPFGTMIVFSLFFGLFTKMPSEGLPYPMFYYVGLLPWMYFAGALSNATNSIVEHQRVITKVYFPRILLPLAAVCSGLIDFGIGLLLVIPMMVVYGIWPAVGILTLPLLLLLAVATAFAASLWLSALNALYRDVRYAVPFLVQLWMFASPVAYPSGVVPMEWRALYALNPMAGVIEGFRWALIGRGEAPGLMLFASVCSVMIVLVGGVVYFQRSEPCVIDRV